MSHRNHRNSQKPDGSVKKVSVSVEKNNLEKKLFNLISNKNQLDYV